MLQKITFLTKCCIYKGNHVFLTVAITCRILWIKAWE